jgi:type VI protein secretion system component VasF
MIDSLVVRVISAAELCVSSSAKRHLVMVGVGSAESPCSAAPHTPAAVRRIGDLDIPQWISWLALVVAGVLAYSGYSRRRR